SWQHFIHGKFYVFRELKKYTVFLTADKKPTIAYGVLALSQPFDELVGPYLPVLTETVLLPFKGMIVYDGLMTGYNISFGGGIKRMLNERRDDPVPSLGLLEAPKAPKARPIPKPPSKEDKDEAVQ